MTERRPPVSAGRHPPERLWRAGRLLAVALFAGAQVFLGLDDTPTADEARHLRDGATLLERGRLEVNPEHPPLVKLLSAGMLGPRLRGEALAAATGDPMTADARFAVQARLIGPRLLRVRLPVIALGVLGLLAFGSLFSRFSSREKFAATLLLAASTPFLAHSHYVTTDLAPVAFFLLSAWAVSRFPNWQGAALAGALIGAALAAKFASPLLAPFALAWVFRRARGRGLAISGGMALFVLLGLEAYATRGMSDAELLRLAHRAFLEGGLGGPVAPSPLLSRACGGLVTLSRPAGAYAIGFLYVAHRSATSAGADYWAARVVTGPEPLYPLATLALKNDLPLLLLALLGSWALLRHRSRVGAGPLIALLAGVTYLLLASRSSLHLGIRHLLPVVVLMAGLAMGGLLLARWRRIFLLLLAAHALVAVIDFPHFVSGRNLLSRLALSPQTAYDLGEDWGQDLGRFLRTERRPLIYLSVLHYRVPEWHSLFPSLREETKEDSLYLVDRLAIDLLAASRRADLSLVARRELAGIQPILDRIDGLLRQRSIRETSEPTLFLLEKRENPPLRGPL